MSNILVAMSGGVDSSVAALRLIEEGHRCTGVTLHLFNGGAAGECAESGCCSAEDILDARRVAFSLKIPHYVFNYIGVFSQQVLARFTEGYGAGAPPHPCIDCNRYIKFDHLLNRAVGMGFDALATGHYARVSFEGGRFLLKKALDPAKDQSYVLYALTQPQLAHTLFPLGGLTKAETRQLACGQGFANAKKRDSQDICFAPDGDYAAAIGRLTGQACPPGYFINQRGDIIGRHRGIIHYTVGQRRGLGLASQTPLYVLQKRPETNTIVVGEEAALYSNQLEALDFNWIIWDTPPPSLRVKARIRYNQREQWATAVPTGPRTVKITFDDPQRAISPGQAVVLYQDDLVVGGGTII